MEPALRRALRTRANGRCEYCQFPEELATLRFQQDHVIPKKHGGADEFGNLAWSCADCNAHKGSDLTGIDPASGRVEPLFNPRSDKWTDHFGWSGPVLKARTAKGRVTLAVLQINRPERIELRRELMTTGLYPV